MAANPESALWAPPPAATQERDVVTAIGEVPLFADLKKSELKRVAARLHHRRYAPGEVIFQQGERGVGMFIVLRGTVRIVQRAKDGSEIELAQLVERQFFGELALLEDAPRSATCVAGDGAELLGFFQPDLEAVIERNAALGSKILWNLARLMGVRLKAVNAAARAKEQEQQQQQQQQRVAAEKPLRAVDEAR